MVNVVLERQLTAKIQDLTGTPAPLELYVEARSSSRNAPTKWTGDTWVSSQGPVVEEEGLSRLQKMRYVVEAM